jgi:hypothetical protein
MADPPPLASDPPARAEDSRNMDALSEVLRFIRLTGGVFLEAHFTAPWSVRSQIGTEDCRLVMTPPATVIGFHYLIDGRALLQIDGMEPVEVRAGEIVLLPRSDPHVLASGSGLAPVDAQELIQIRGEHALARIDHGGGGVATNVVCGFIGCEAHRHPLLDALPRVLGLNLNGRRGADWVASSFRFAAREVAAARPGSATVLAKLSELLFVEAVREYIAGLPPERSGWLAGLRDPAVGRALALIHARPAHAWTARRSPPRPCCRAPPSPSASPIWSALRRCPTSPPGACRWRRRRCARAGAASRRSRKPSAMNPKRASHAPSSAKPASVPGAIVAGPSREAAGTKRRRALSDGPQPREDGTDAEPCPAPLFALSATRSRRRPRPRGAAAGRRCLKAGRVARRFPSRGRALVRAALRSADAGAGAGLAGDPRRPQRARRRAHRLGQDAGGLPRRPRRTGACRAGG